MKRIDPNETRAHRKHMAKIIAKGWGIGKPQTRVSNVIAEEFSSPAKSMWLWPLLIVSIVSVLVAIAI